jgi:hypothetical protein
MSVKPRSSHPHHLATAALKTVLGMSVRGAWSRPISSRADVKLAPSMARPNLFCGD